jgi:uncharacterized protein YegP (UPF0339 family)
MAEPPERTGGPPVAKFTVYTDKHNEFRWKFIASNNTVIAKSGESFKKQEDCLTSLTLLQKDITGASTDFQLRHGVVPATAVASPPVTPPVPPQN